MEGTIIYNMYESVETQYERERRWRATLRGLRIEPTPESEALWQQLSKAVADRKEGRARYARKGKVEA